MAKSNLYASFFMLGILASSIARGEVPQLRIPAGTDLYLILEGDIDLDSQKIAYQLMSIKIRLNSYGYFERSEVLSTSNIGMYPQEDVSRSPDGSVIVFLDDGMPPKSPVRAFSMENPSTGVTLTLGESSKILGYMLVDGSYDLLLIELDEDGKQSFYKIEVKDGTKTEVAAAAVNRLSTSPVLKWDGDEFRFYADEFSNIPVSDSQLPPSELLARIERWVLLRYEQYRILLPLVRFSEGSADMGRLLFKEPRAIWENIGLSSKGDLSQGQILGPWGITKVGWSYEESDKFGPAWTGEWIFRNYMTDLEQSLMLGSSARVLYASEESIIIAENNLLVYYAARQNLIDDQSPVTVLDHPGVARARFAFFGRE